MPTGIWKGCSFLSIDPGINYTGLAVYKIDLQGNLRINKAVAISTPDCDDLERAGLIVEMVEAHIHTEKPAFLFLERPPNTIYYQGRLSPGAIIARAQSVFKVIGVTYAISARLRREVGLKVIPIDPVKWQERSKAKRDGLDIKDWSLRLANSLLQQISDISPSLHSNRDENIADAISMGYLAYQREMMN